MVIYAILFLLTKLGGQTHYGLAAQYVGSNPHPVIGATGGGNSA